MTQKIKLHFYGGAGEDTYNLGGGAKKQIFDSGTNKMLKTERTKIKKATAEN